MTGLKILSITPFASATFLAASTGAPPYLQYGALGLCLVCVVFLCQYINKQAERLDRKDKVLGDLYAKNTEAFNRLADMLDDRPCLDKDHRIKG